MSTSETSCNTLGQIVAALSASSLRLKQCSSSAPPSVDGGMVCGVVGVDSPPPPPPPVGVLVKEGADGVKKSTISSEYALSRVAR